jgi:peptide/nickel transport system substrate-binding protein
MDIMDIKEDDRLNKLLFPIAFLPVCAFVLTGCTNTTTTSVPAIPAASTPAGSMLLASADDNAGQPLYGGTLRSISSAGPQVLGGFEGNAGDAFFTSPAIESLLDAASDRGQGNGLEPVLAESYTEDVANKKIVFKLRRGVKFQDGTDFNADAVLWNYQQLIENNRLQYADKWNGTKKIDNYTVEFYFKEYNNQLIQSWGLKGQRSPGAYQKASGGDVEKGKLWNRTNAVGTGPFILQEFVKDDHITWVKNTNYWRLDRPYLDGIEMKFVPDPAAAQSLMQSGQADQWRFPPTTNQQTLVNAGFKRVAAWPGRPFAIWPNTSDPDSKWHNLKLRQALDYALDKKAIAQAIGKGLYKPMTQVAPEGEWGYDPNYPVRSYDVSKARQMLAEAGYPNGLNASLLILNDAESQDAGMAIKQYLAAAGITINLNVADPGRFNDGVWGKNTPTGDLSWTSYGKDITNFVTYMRWFSNDSSTIPSYFGHTNEQKAMDDLVKVIQDPAGQKAMTGILMKWMTDNARITPVYEVPLVITAGKYVHTTELTQGFVRWQTEEVWMEKH